MANTSRPQGFRPKGKPLRVNKYVAAAAIYPGDAVKQESGGRAQAVSLDATEYTGAVLGVAISYASGAGQEVLVADDPQQLFIVASSGTNPDAQTDVGLNYSILGSDPSTAYRISRQRMKQDSGVSDSNLPLKLLGVDERPDNALGASADCIVAINNHALKGGTGTTGV